MMYNNQYNANTAAQITYFVVEEVDFQQIELRSVFCF